VAAGRFGGEEFVVLVQGSMDQMAELAETIRNSTQALRGPIIGPDGALNLKEFWNCTLSVGCSSSRTQGYDANRLVAAADQALFGAKRSGRNQVRAA
jgi:diguanylate cyclase (GGDEF)-like protein